MKILNDFSISMISYVKCFIYFILTGIIFSICLFLEKISYGYQLLGVLFITIPAIILGTVYYFRFLYINLLLWRTYYVLGNKPRFWIFTLLLLIYLIPFFGWIFALITPFIIQSFVAITDKNKVQQALNLAEPNDFYQFKKLRKALLEQMKHST